MRRTLVVAAEAIIRQAIRNCPRTGSLPAGKECFTERTVASTAERKLWLWPLCARYSLRRLFHLPVPTEWTLSHPTPKARPALPADFHHPGSSGGQTAQRISGAQRPQPQLTLGSRSHRAFSETLLPSRQAAGTRAVPNCLPNASFRY